MTEAHGCTVNLCRTMHDTYSFILSSVSRQERGLFQSRLSVRSSTSSSEFQNPLISFSSSSCCLRLLPHIPVTSILSFIFPLIACFRRKFLGNTRQITFYLFLCVVCTIFLSPLIRCNTLSFFQKRSNLSSRSSSSTTL
jgi:ABC-type anion transport system duplicated permease subunit